MDKVVKEFLSYRTKVAAMEILKEFPNRKKLYEFLGIPKSTFYYWSKKYNDGGLEALKKKKPIAKNHPKMIQPAVIKRVLDLRKDYQLGSWRIVWYLERYHAIKISESSVSRILRKHNVNRLGKHASKRTLHTKRYAKLVPGHHVQVDVKFLIFYDKGSKVKRFQYTAIDDATRIRALKIYSRHTQVNAIDFVDYVVSKFPFRINTIRTDNGHEFQAKFHWHVEDNGMRHQYIKPGTPQLNGKVERSHRTDQKEFYQLLSYTDDVDLNQKLAYWENFYNFDRPHGAFNGKTPYEALKSLLT
jgi:transposase InsO family protein